MSKIFIQTINFYQKYLSFDTGVLRVLTPGGACKFETSCSEYTKLSIQKYGVLKGLRLGLARIWRCR